MLLAWQLPEKRGELLKLVVDDIQGLEPDNVVFDETLYSGQIGEPRYPGANVDVSHEYIHRLSASLPGLRGTKRARNEVMSPLLRYACCSMLYLSAYDQRYAAYRK